MPRIPPMDSSSGTPSWLAALIAIAALSAAIVFGFYLFRHTERAALEAQNYRLAASLKPLRIEEASVKDRIKPLDEQIAERRARLDAVKEMGAAVLRCTHTRHGVV